MLDGTKVIVPGVGHFYTAPVGTAKPTNIDNPADYGVKITGATAGTFAITVGTGGTSTTTPIAYNAVVAAVKSALEALTTVGVGNVDVAGVAGDYEISFANSVSGIVSVDGALLTGAGAAATLTALWGEIGHTDKDSPMQVNRGGGDVTSLDSWQQPGLDSSQADVTWALAFSLLQYDAANLKLYYGSNATVGLDGSVAVKKKATPTEAALFLRIENGTKRQWRHYDRVQIIAADGENFDTSKLGSMPVQATILGLDTSDTAFTVSPVA